MGSFRGRAAAVAFVRDGGSGIQIYLSRRPAHFRYYPGAFVFPGGRVDDADGDLRETARREVREEIGVDIDPGQLVLLRETLTSAHAGPVYHMFIFAYPVEGDFQTRLNRDEVEEEVWVEPVEALERFQLPYQIRVAVEMISRFERADQLIEALSEGLAPKDRWF